MEEKQITIAATLSGSITLASQQNAVPVIRDLSVANDTLQTLENLKLEFFAKPDFVAKKTWHIDRIAPESTVHIRDVDVALNGQLLNELSEAISGEAFLSLCKGEEAVAETRRDIRLLGVDVAGIWRRVREEIKDEPGFEVVEDVVLGTFSFSKYLMWKDLVDRTDQLKLNPVVKHLIETPREVYANNIAFPHQRELDSKYSPERIFTPLPTDSSQLVAIMASAAGKDFVLIGPPGTGKSQTIANMIAHNLAEGRKVLFVAEKVTALNVVYRRLKKLGLGDFCLELHSNKAKKAEVLDQLRSAWASKGEFSESEWKREAMRLKSLRDDLGNYVNRIHAKYRNGLTPYLAIGQVIANENIPIAKLSWP